MKGSQNAKTSSGQLILGEGLKMKIPIKDESGFYWVGDLVKGKVYWRARLDWMYEQPVMSIWEDLHVARRLRRTTRSSK